MKIEFKFNSKSSGQNVPQAILIAEKHGGVIENRFYKIYFDAPDDDDLSKLYELVGNLKGTTISINGGKPIIAGKFFRAVNCPEKFLCKGVCKHVYIGYHSIDSFLEMHSEDIEEGVFSTSDENIIRLLTDFLEILDENQFRINKKSFLEYFLRETEMEHKFCKKYSVEKVEKEIEKLPAEIQLVMPEEREVEYEEEIEAEDVLRKILSHCEISSTLSFEDILHCSRAMTLLIREIGCTTVEDSDILIYSFPSIKQLILAKLIVIEDIPEEIEDIEIKYTTSKENEFFCASNPYSKLYFQIFNENDPRIEEHFEKLKNKN